MGSISRSRKTAARYAVVGNLKDVFGNAWPISERFMDSSEIYDSQPIAEIETVGRKL